MRWLLLASWCLWVLVAGSAVPNCDESSLHCFDATCGLRADTLSVDMACPCVEEDFGYDFTPCDAGTKNLVYFRKPPAVCRGGLAMPSTVTGIPCNATCPGGAYLDLTTMECTMCGAGTYSVGGGVLYEPPWRRLPTQVSTNCIPTQGPTCSSWQASGEYIDSGDNFGNHGIQSLLEIQTEITFEGAITFTYRLSSAIGDRFILTDNGIIVVSAYLTMRDFRTVTVPLAVGQHILRFFYSKDGGYSTGLDRVMVRDIEIVGLNDAEVECSLCPPGSTSAAGSRECEECPVNTYSTAYGSPECKSCPAGMRSYMGATFCVPSANCTAFDWSVYTSPCEHGTQQVTYAWLQPMACDPTLKGSVPLPATQEEACTPPVCPKGSEPDIGSVCTPCAAGSSSPGNNHACVTCPPGQAATGSMLYVTNYNVSWITTDCTGSQCGTPGWRFGGNFVDSGARHGAFSTSRLIVKVDHTAVMFMDFNWTISCHPNSAIFQITTNGIMKVSTGCAATCTEKMHTQRLRVDPDPSGTSTITFVYRKINNVLDNSCDFVRLYSLSFDGVASPTGSSACTECKPGYISSHGETCAPCEAGDYAPTSESSVCLQCSQGQFNRFPGSDECLTCGAGTVSLRNHEGCEYSCEMYVPRSNITYDLHNISQLATAVGLVLDPHDRNTSYAFSLCSPFPAHHVCAQLRETGWTPLSKSINDSMPQQRQQKRSRVEDIPSSFKLSTRARYAVEHEEEGDVPVESREETNPLDERLIPSFACQINTGTNEAMSIGSVWGMRPMDNIIDGVTLEINYGSITPACDNLATRIDLFCDRGAGVGRPEPIESGDQCIRAFKWHSFYGCRRCLATDYEQVPSECELPVYRWKPEAVCFGGVRLPPAQACLLPTSQVVSKSDVVVSHAKLYMIVAVVVVLVLALGVVAAVQWRRTRQTYAMYARLNTNEASNGGLFSIEDDNDGADPNLGTGEFLETPAAPTRDVEPEQTEDIDLLAGRVEPTRSTPTTAAPIATSAAEATSATPAATPAVPIAPIEPPKKTATSSPAQAREEATTEPAPVDTGDAAEL